MRKRARTWPAAAGPTRSNCLCALSGACHAQQPHPVVLHAAAVAAAAALLVRASACRAASDGAASAAASSAVPAPGAAVSEQGALPGQSGQTGCHRRERCCWRAAEAVRLQKKTPRQQMWIESSICELDVASAMFSAMYNTALSATTQSHAAHFST